jgi:anti-anti-sigma factor
MAHQQLDVRVVGGATVVRFRDEDLTGPGALVLAEQLLRLADRPRLRLDFSRVGHLSAAALGALLRLHRRVQAAGGLLTVENLGPLPYEVFAATRLTRVFRILPAAAPGPAFYLPDGWRLLGREDVLPGALHLGAGA